MKIVYKRIFVYITIAVLLTTIGYFSMRSYYSRDQLIKHELTQTVVQDSKKHEYDIRNVDYTIVVNDDQTYAIITFEYTNSMNKQDYNGQSLYEVNQTWYGKHLFKQYVTIYGEDTEMKYNYYDNSNILFWGLNKHNYDKILIKTNTGYTTEIKLPDNEGYVIKYNYEDIKNNTDYNGDYPFINVNYFKNDN